ncbi:MAG: hypothetical protein L3J35_07760 [Bacteroidales bacterium]|nr:hypothetical protein [Bacteroidales bacterium]
MALSISNINMVFKPIVLILLLFISSCRYFNVATLIYEHTYDYPANTIDSACMNFMDEAKEHHIDDSVINNTIRKYARDTIYRNKMEFYKKNGYYYPFAPGIMNKYYLCKSPNNNFYYWFVVGDFNSYNSLQLVWVKKDSLDSRAISYYSIDRKERNAIREKFKDEVISKIDSILQEIE